MNSRSSSRFLGIITLLIALMISSCASTSSSTRKLSKKERIEGLMNIAAAAIAENDPITAIESLNQVKALDDRIPREHFLYALAYLNKNELALAEDSARKAIQLDPAYTAAKNTLGKVLMDRGNLKEAESLLKEAASDILFREAALPKINLGILYFNKMDYANSEKWLNKAVFDGGPLTCMARFYLGKIQFEKGDFDKASRNLAAGIKGSCSSLSEAHITFGKNLIRQKRHDEARAKFIEIQKLFPDSDASERASQYLREIP